LQRRTRGAWASADGSHCSSETDHNWTSPAICESCKPPFQLLSTVAPGRTKAPSLVSRIEFAYNYLWAGQNESPLKYRHCEAGPPRVLQGKELHPEKLQTDSHLRIVASFCRVFGDIVNCRVLCRFGTARSVRGPCRLPYRLGCESAAREQPSLATPLVAFFSTFRFVSFKCSSRVLSASCRLHRPRVGDKLSVLRSNVRK